MLHLYPNNLAACRSGIGMSIADLATKSGIEPLRLCAIEAGIASLTAKEIGDIAEALGTEGTHAFPEQSEAAMVHAMALEAGPDKGEEVEDFAERVRISFDQALDSGLANAGAEGGPVKVLIDFAGLNAFETSMHLDQLALLEASVGEGYAVIEGLTETLVVDGSRIRSIFSRQDDGSRSETPLDHGAFDVLWSTGDVTAYGIPADTEGDVAAAASKLVGLLASFDRLQPDDAIRFESSSCGERLVISLADIDAVRIPSTMLAKDAWLLAEEFLAATEPAEGAAAAA